MDKLFQRISLKMLRYFYEVACCGQFTRAAEQLSVTKSPLSSQIKELEQLLGVSLFERHTRLVVLTAAGRQMKLECERVFGTLESGLYRVQQVEREQSGTLNIGLMSSIFWAGFGDALQQIKTSFPDCRYTMLEMAPEKQIQGLLTGQIDLGLVRYADTQNVAPLSCTILFSETMWVAMSAQNPLHACSTLSLSQLAGEKMVMLSRDNSASTAMIVQSCRQQGFLPDIVQEVVEPNTVLAIVSTSDSLSLVPASYRHLRWGNVCFIPLRETIRADICAVYNPERSGSQVHGLIQSLKERLA